MPGQTRSYLTKPLVCILAASVLGGCAGGSLLSKVIGTWRVEPSSITTSRLPVSAASKQDWIDATKELAKIEVRFSTSPNAVQANGIGRTASGEWALVGTTIHVTGSKDHWPEMTIDSQGSRIHLTDERGGDTLQMDLVKVR